MNPASSIATAIRCQPRDEAKAMPNAPGWSSRPMAAQVAGRKDRSPPSQFLPMKPLERRPKAPSVPGLADVASSAPKRLTMLVRW